MGFLIRRADKELWWSDRVSNWVADPREGRVWATRDLAVNAVSRISRYTAGKFAPERFVIKEFPDLVPPADEAAIFGTPIIFKLEDVDQAKEVLGLLRGQQLKIEGKLTERQSLGGPAQKEWLGRRADLRFALSCIIRKARYVNNWINIQNTAEKGYQNKTTRRFGLSILTEAEKTLDLFMSCKERGLSDEDAREVALDQLAILVCELYGTPSSRKDHSENLS